MKSVTSAATSEGRRRPRPSLSWAVAGFVLWASCLVVLYALLSIACRGAPDTAISEPLLRALLLGAWAAHALIIAWLLLRARRAVRSEVFMRGEPAAAGFVHGLALLLNAAALLSTGWIGLPVMVLPPCA